MTTVLLRKLTKSLLGQAVNAARGACITILLPFLLSAPSAFAQETTGSSPAILTSNRFLFVIDNSALMRKHVDDIRAAINETLQSSANGQLHAGDTIGVWTFNQDLHTGLLPLQNWKPEDAEEINLRLREFVRQQTFEKSSRLDLAVSAINKIVKISDLVTVVIISDGKSPIQGTPFDNDINHLYLQAVHDMKGKSRAVVTVLQGKAGNYTPNYNVSARPWPIAIPALPLSLKSIAGGSSNTPARAAEVAEAPQAPASMPVPKAKPASASASLVLVGPQSSPSRPSVVIPASNSPQPADAPLADSPVSLPAQQVTETSPVPPSVTASPPPAAALPINPAAFNNPNPVPPPSTFVGKVVVAPAQPAAMPESARPAPANLLGRLPESRPDSASVRTVSATRESTPASPVAQADPPPTKAKSLLTPVTNLLKPTRELGGYSLLSGLLGLLALAAMILLVMVRRAHAHDRISLISQTLHQGRN